MTSGGLHRIVLVGFMGAGKSQVGRSLARALAWRFEDLDEVVEREVGASVREIFEVHGEARFRALEAAAAARLLLRDRLVLATGGGWGAVPGRLDELPPGTESFWLRVQAEEALRRASEQPGRRPLLDRPDPLEAARILLAEREPHYRRAGRAVDTDGRSVEDVSARILQILAREYPENKAE